VTIVVLMLQKYFGSKSKYFTWN